MKRHSKVPFFALKPHCAIFCPYSCRVFLHQEGDVFLYNVITNELKREKRRFNMFKLKILFYGLLLVMLFGCAPIMATPSPAPASTNPAPIINMAVVQGVEVQFLEAEPLQANAIIRGQLPDGGCTTISSVN